MLILVARPSPPSLLPRRKPAAAQPSGCRSGSRRSSRSRSRSSDVASRRNIGSGAARPLRLAVPADNARDGHRLRRAAARGHRPARLRPAPDRRRAADGARARAPAALDGYPTLTPTDTREIVYAILSNDQRQRLENDWQLDFAYSVPGPRALPRQRLLPARGDRRRLPPDPVRDPAARGARPAAGRRTSSRASRAASCSSPARPARASRPRSRR